MNSENIKCPECNSNIKISEALLKQFSDSYTKKINDLTKKLSLAESKNESTEEELAALIDQAVIKKEKELREELKKSLKKVQEAKLEDMAEQLNEKEEQLKKVRDEEIKLRKEVRKAKEKEDNLELEVQRKLDDAIMKGREEGHKKTLDEYSKKDKEREMLISNLRKELTQMKTKVEQGSQQLQGEVLELELEGLLFELFPGDEVLPVPKGRNGADVEHMVISPAGKECGKILWETKRTKRWNSEWVDKLKKDMLEDGAMLGVIISDVMPDTKEKIVNMSGVWIANPDLAKGLALVLRQSVLEVGRMRTINKNQDEKAKFLYDYLTSTSFKNRVEKLVDSFVSMKSDLDKEKRVISRTWKLREKQLEVVIETTSSLVGEIQGTLGRNEFVINSLEPEVEQLEV